ncbi:MAG: hypothetical protein R3F19_10355 [Verrucomicrobiales bacterium]|nr:hypothetical protein [Verrucomicrobiae bacterium]
MFIRAVRVIAPAWALASLACDKPQRSTIQSPPAEPIQIEQLLFNSSSGVLKLPFSEVVQQVSGKRILPVDQADGVTALFIDAVAVASDRAIAQMNAANSPVKQLRRINEASRLFEDALIQSIDSTSEFEAGTPATAAGNHQRSGYPDIRIVHVESQRVFYLDPKLYESTSENSSLRTFYFTPKAETNKVLDDACHLLLGIAHDGNDGDWTFLRWSLVDLSKLTVRLKPEFQASNRDIYRAEATIRSGNGAD